MSEDQRRHIYTEVHLRLAILIADEEVADLLDGEDRGSEAANIQEALDRHLESTLIQLSIAENEVGVKGTRLKILSVDSAPNSTHHRVETTTVPGPSVGNVRVVACPSCCARVLFDDSNISTEHYGWDRVRGLDTSASFIDCPVCDDSIPLCPGEEHGYGVTMWEWVEAPTPSHEYKTCKTKGEERDVGI